MISSESSFFWRQIFFIVKFPLLLILVLFGRRDPSELLHPIKEAFDFLIEAKITLALIMTNLLVFLIEILFLGPEGVLALAFKPSDIIELNLIPIVSSWFLHASLLHLGGNMLFLFVFGRIIENELGPVHMSFIYFGSAVISTLVSGFFGQGGIGASGAISGLIAAGILLKPFYFTYLIAGIPLPIILVGWAGIIADIFGVLIPKDDNIGHFAHLGGYAAISVLVFFLNPSKKRKMLFGLIINILFVLAIALLYARYGLTFLA